MSPENVRDIQSARKVIVAKEMCPSGIQRNIFGSRIVLSGGTVYRSVDIGNPAVDAGIDPMGFRTRNKKIGRSGNRMHLKI